MSIKRKKHILYTWNTHIYINYKLEYTSPFTNAS